MNTFRMKHEKHGTCIADEVAEPQLLELGWVREGAAPSKGAQAPASPAGGKKDKGAQAPASPASPAAAGGSEDLALEDLG